MEKRFCDYLKSESERCTVLETKCLPSIRNKQQKCAFAYHYLWLTNLTDDKPEANRIKSEVKPQACNNWRKFMQENMPSGRKNMTAKPLEDSIRNALRRNLSDYEVQVKDKPGKLSILGEGAPIVDCHVTKEGYPDSIISIKTWLNQESVRETFGYAYMAKYLEGQKRYRIFMVCLNQIKALREVIDTYKPFLDGVYSLSGEPYFDDLLDELRIIYNYRPEQC